MSMLEKSIEEDQSELSIYEKADEYDKIMAEATEIGKSMIQNDEIDSSWNDNEPVDTGRLQQIIKTGKSRDVEEAKLKLVESTLFGEDD